MGLLRDEDAEQLAAAFAGLDHPVELLLFSQQHECAMCRSTRKIVEELAALGGRVSAAVLDFVADAERAEALGVDKVPAIVLLSGGRDSRLRFYGVPAGYEFSALIEDVLDIGRGAPDLPAMIADRASAIGEPVHLQVAVSPTCPYCAQAVRAAHKLALAAEKVRADMIEMSEFPHLAVKYGIKGVPHTVINEQHAVVGAVAEHELLDEILDAIGE